MRLNEFSDDELRAELERRTAPAPPQRGWPRIGHLYVHGSRESAWDTVTDLGFAEDSEPWKLACYAAYEHKMTYSFAENGDSTLIAVDGRLLSDNPLPETGQ